MNKEQMLENLMRQAQELRDELIELDQKMSAKKELFIKAQGAIEALNALTEEPQEPA